jgi:hypothetical protein
MMITINSLSSNGQIKPIMHKGDNPERNGKIMTKKELHEFGLALLIVYLYKQKGELIRANNNIGNEYPHLVAKNPNGELLYIWVKTEMYPTIPSVKSIANPEVAITLSKQFKATPVFTGIRLKCLSSIQSEVPIYGGEYKAEYIGLKEISLDFQI